MLPRILELLLMSASFLKSLLAFEYCMLPISRGLEAYYFLFREEPHREFTSADPLSLNCLNMFCFSFLTHSN